MCVNLYIGNLPLGTTAKELQDHFSSHGTVTSAKVMADRYLQDGHEDMSLWKCPLKKKQGRRSSLYIGVFWRKNIKGSQSPSG